MMPLHLAEGIAAWLRSCQTGKEHRLQDSVHQLPGTYADGFAALVFSLLGWIEPRDNALAISLSRPPESEFDSLAQALTLRFAAESIESPLLQRLEERPLYDGQAMVSNNWKVFRGLTLVLRGQMRPDLSPLDLQGRQGLFPDSPIGSATPTCYHAKTCASLALLERLQPKSGRTQSLRMGLDALVAMVSPQGVLLPYGRSRNTLFGYASAYLALRLGAQQFDSGLYAWGADAVLKRMTAFRADDGHLPAVLNRDEWLRKDWDVYINNPDYNAFAAACLLLSIRIAPHLPPPQPPSEGVVDLERFLICRSGGAYFACSTTGEYAPFGSPFFCDTRYAGMVPLVFDDGQQIRLFDEGYCWDGRDETRSALVDPRVSPMIPYLHERGRCYWVRSYGQVSYSFKNQVLALRGQGIPVSSQPLRGWRRVLNRLMRRPSLQMLDRSSACLAETSLTVDFGARVYRLRTSCRDSAGTWHRGHRQEALLCAR